ncbi:g10406 [Coccomyxa viridis]|uniref:G10406 protein n=1 Tax=Coccomyxa viridis TaxID=1274662 RepID=A0ABP1G9J7_9CHLO
MYRISQEGNIEWSLGQLQAEFDLELSIILVSVSGAQVDGFVCGWHVSGELQVMLLAVSRNRQRQGIGTALLEKLLCIGKGLGNTSAYLELREGNETAMRLYGRAGFSEVGRRRRYYENGDTAILMCKDLTIQF